MRLSINKPEDRKSGKSTNYRPANHRSTTWIQAYEKREIEEVGENPDGLTCRTILPVLVPLPLDLGTQHPMLPASKSPLPGQAVPGPASENYVSLQAKFLEPPE